MHYFRKIVLITALGLLGAGCNPVQTITNTVEQANTERFTVSYYPTQCNTNPWGKQYDEVVIQDYYTSVGLNIYDVAVQQPAPNFITCSACGCGTGFEVVIETDAAGKADLIERGFTEDAAESIPEDSNINAVIIPEANVNTVPTYSASEINEGSLETNDEVIEDVDAELQVVAGRIQEALSIYYAREGHYPETLAELELDIDPTGTSYTPIGVLPAEFYDLTVDYSTGSETLNP